MTNAPTTREAADHAELARDIRALCNGHPHAMISWPHRELHALADRAENLLSEIAALRGLLDERDLEIAEDDAAMRDLDAQIEDANDRATQAERQRDELRKALEDHDQTAAECRIDGARPQRDTTAPCELCGATQRESCGRKGSAAYAFISSARTLLANQGADQ